MSRKIFTFCIALLASTSLIFPASAWLIQKPAAAGYVGPGDVVAFTSWSGLRGYSGAAAAAGTTKMIRVRKPSSGEICDILVASTGGMGNTANCTGASNGTIYSTFCAINSCRITTRYDQVAGNACGGASCDAVQATTANQPTLNCCASLSIIEESNGGNPIALTSANNFTPSTGILSMSVAGDRTVNIRDDLFLGDVGSGNRIHSSPPNTANQWQLTGGSSGTILMTANDGVWQSAQGVFNGASSVIRINGSETTGTVTASTTAAKPTTIMAAGAGGFSTKEQGWIDNYALSPAERASLETNMRTYWGF